MVEKTTPTINDYRGNIEDLITIAEKMTPHCENLEELVGVLKLSLENDGQLRLIISVISSQVKR